MRFSSWRAFAALVGAGGLVMSACGGSSNAGSSASGTSSTTGGKSASGAAATPSDTPPAASLTLSETGSTLLYPLFQQWASAYHAKYPNISITPQGTGSGTGISQAEAGTVDIGASDAYLPPSAFAAHPGIENIPLAISAQQVNYNLPGLAAGTHLKLNGSILAQMYTGKITTWSDPAIQKLNPGVKLPNLKVVPLHRSDGSGDTFLFTTYMSKSDPSVWTGGFGTSVTWPSVAGALAANGNGGMVTTCAATPGCVAYIGISFLAQTQSKGLGEAMLENQAGNYLLPTPTTIKAEAAGYASKTPANEAISLVYGPASNGYPIINYEYAIVSANQSSPTTAAAVRALLYWALDSAGGSTSSLLSSVNFQALPPQVVKLSDSQIAKIH